jgi:hypothetical protein
LYFILLRFFNGNESALRSGNCATEQNNVLFGIYLNYGKILDEEYIASVKDKKYISPDKVIDGSTSLFPETTWYIRDLHHDDFGQLHDPVLEIMRYDLDGDSEKYPRFLRNVNGGLQPADENKEAVKEEDNIFASAIRFFTAIINFIIKLIKK